MFFTFILLITSLILSFWGEKIYAGDLLEEAFKPAMRHETIINLWAGKNAVGNEILRESVVVQDSFGIWCFVQGQRWTKNQLDTKANEIWATGLVTNQNYVDFCQNILWGDWDVQVFQTEAPLIVRMAKFLLRITMVLSVTMVIFNGIMWIIESAKWAEVKDAKKNITLVIVGVLIALMSLSIINLITSVTKSSL